MSVRALELARLYASERGRLRAFIRRVVGNADTAEDVVQQAFANVMATADAPRLNAAYLTQTARNLALNHLRDMRRRGEIELSEDDLARLADRHPSPEMVVLYRSELHRLLKAIAALPPRRREAFVLRRIEGLSYDEIAARMGISRNTVMSQIIAAMSELERKLDR